MVAAGLGDNSGAFFGFHDLQQERADLAFDGDGDGGGAVDQHEGAEGFGGEFAGLFFADQLFHFTEGGSQGDQAGKDLDGVSFDDGLAETEVQFHDDEPQVFLGEEFDQAVVFGELPAGLFQQFQVAGVIDVAEAVGVEGADFEIRFMWHDALTLMWRWDNFQPGGNVKMPLTLIHIVSSGGFRFAVRTPPPNRI